jgi:diguanylate cyclase (GGDEF)-like protein/PAS domain S-box-containing protein
MRLFKVKSLSVRLFIIILVTVLPLLALIAYNVQQDQANTAAEADRTAEHLVQMAVDDQQNMVMDVKEELGTAVDVYRDLGNDREQCDMLFSHLVSNHPRYKNMMIIHQNGNIACQAYTGTETFNPDFIVQASRSEAMISIMPKLDSQNAPGQQEASFAIHFETSKGETALAVAVLQPYWLNQAYESYKQEYPEAELFVFDSGGNILNAMPPPDQWQNASSVMLDAANRGDSVVQTVGLQGISQIYGLSPLKNGPDGQKIFVAVGIPLAKVEASKNKHLLLDLLVCGLAILFSLAASRMSASWLVIRWLQPVVKAVRRLEGGDLTARSELINDGTDLGRLANTFDNMASALEQRTNELHLALDKYQGLFNRSPIGLYRSTPNGILLEVNPSMGRMLGFTTQDMCAPIHVEQFYIERSEREAWKQIIASDGILIDYELRMRRADGEIVYTLDNAVAIYDPDGNVLYYEGSLQDITNRKRIEANLKEANQKLSIVLNSITDAYVVWDDQWYFLEINQVAVREIFGGRPATELLGKVIWEEYPQAVETEFYRQYQTAITEGQPVHFEAKSNINGRWWETHAYPYPGRLEAYSRDITERKSAEVYMSELAYHDLLTGLLNRKAFQDEMRRSLSRVQRNGNKLAVFFIDLDNFKAINDVYDHDTGDVVLVNVADRLRSVLRTEDILSRLGGDEFTITAEIIQVEDAVLIAERVLKVFEEPVQANRATVQVSLSIGVSIYPDNADNPEMLIRMADHTMYQVKRAGKGQFHLAT